MNLRRAVVIAVLLLLAALSVQARRTNPHDLSVVHRVVLRITYPVEWLGARVWGGLSGVWQSGAELFTAKRRLETLERELDRARRSAVQAARLEHENEQLRDFAGLAPLLPEPALGARVLTRGSSGRGRTMRINRGAQHGLGVGDVVLGRVGMVGRVVELQPRTALVMELTDERSVLAVRVGSSARPAFLLGDGDTGLRLDGISEQYRDELFVGDPVWTSGEDDSAPPGLAVGYVTEVPTSARGLHLEIRVAPYEDLDALTVVQVLGGG